MGAVFLSKLLGFLYRMQFMRVAGEEAVGTYMAAYPAFIFFLSLVQLGIPIAVAKIIAELHAKKERTIKCCNENSYFIDLSCRYYLISFDNAFHSVFVQQFTS